MHTPLDVSVAFVTAAALVLALWPLMKRPDTERRLLPMLLGAVALCAAAYLVYVTAYPFPEDVDADNLASGTKNAFSLAGAVLGLIAVWYADGRWIRFDTKAPWYGQALKLALGLALLLAVKQGLKAPLSALFAGGNFAHLVRYFLVVLAAGCGWPLTFPFFARLGRGKEKT